MRTLVAIGAVFLLAGAQAAKAVEPATEVEAGITRDNLDRGYSDWSSLYVEGARYFAPRLTLYGTLRETERFDLRDSELSGGLYFPLGPAWTALVEGSGSSTHRVLARHSVFAQLQRSFAGGWSLNAGWRHSEYSRTGADVLVFGAERYWADWRAAYTLYSGRPEGAGSAPAHRFELHRYYAERSSIGAAFSTGREVENVGPPAGVITSDIRSLSLIGRHWITPAWALSYELHRLKQGSLYDRQGLQVGLRHRF